MTVAPRIKGYSLRAEPANAVQGRPAWHAKVRRAGWRPGYWVTVSSDYGSIVYETPDAAVTAARWWAAKNESRA